MNSELAAIAALTLYALVASTIVVWQAVRCEEGWKVWLLYVLQGLYGSLAFRWRSNRPCPFPKEGQAIIIANHRSPLDPLMLWMNHHLGMQGRIRTIRFIMAREYYENRAVGWICRWVGSIPVQRNGQDMRPAREALRQLNQGRLIGVFPEGGINFDETTLRPGNPGVAWLALRSRAPVYPVFIHNTPQGRNIIEPFYKFQQVRITYGEPIDLSPYYECRKSQELLKEITDLLMAHVAELGGVDYRPLRAKQQEEQPGWPHSGRVIG